MELTIERTRLNRSAHQKFATVKPAISELANIIRAAFITSVKSPRVIMVIGIVRSRIRGFMNVLIRPRTNATIRADKRSDTVTPCKMYAVI